MVSRHVAEQLSSNDEEINMLWEDCPLSNGLIPLRTFHEHRKGIKEMFGVDIVCDRSHGNVYYVKNPEVLDKQKVAKWLLHKYSIPQDFATFNSIKDRIFIHKVYNPKWLEKNCKKSL